MKTKDCLPLRVISHNIRYAPIIPSPGEARWEERLPLLASHLHYHASMTSSIICLQEVLQHQLLDLLSHLNATSPPCPTSKCVQGLESSGHDGSAQWAYIGVGRDDGGEAGEYVPIFYQPSVFELREHTVEWLSPRPKEKGWDAGCIRIITIAIFAHRESKQEFLVMNTHLDNSGVIARRESAKLIEKLSQRWRRRESSDGRASEDFPLILTGDLNSDENGEAYQILTDRVGHDAKYLCHVRARYGEEMTFTGFRNRKNDEERIDYVFVSPKRLGSELSFKGMDEKQNVHTCRGWSVVSYAVLPNRFESSDGVFQSDHRAVVADLQFL